MHLVKENNNKKIIQFTKNWNNKLNCDYFTTIRLYPKKIGETYSIHLNNKFLFEAVVVFCEPIALKELYNMAHICYLDTGMSPENTVTLLKKMYKQINDDTLLYIILLKGKRGLNTLL